MGILCTKQLPHSKTLTTISYSKLDKLIFVVHNYINDQITENQLIKLFPLINIKDLNEEKNNTRKKRHYNKWYEMALSKSNKILSQLSLNEIIKTIENENENEKENKENKKENNLSLLEKISLSIEEISNSEQGLRNYYISNPIHFESRIFKSPPLIFRWLSWLIMSGIPINRPYIYYYNLLTYDLNEESEIQIQKDLNRTIESKYFNIEDFKESLYRILKAISILDKEMSYVQGINFIVGFLLVISNRNENDTFYFIMALFSYTFAFKFGIRGFYLENFPLIHSCIKVFEIRFKKYFLNVFNHFEKIGVPYICWITPWIQMIYVNVFPNKDLLRIWDCFFCIGIPFLISFGLSIVELIQNDVLEINDLTQIQEYFKLFNPEIKNNFKNKEKKIEYDIEFLINNSIKKYNINEDEISEVLQNDFKDYKIEYSYDYKKIKPNKNYKLDNLNNKKINNNKYLDSDEELEVGQETINTNERITKKGIKFTRLLKNTDEL